MAAKLSHQNKLSRTLSKIKRLGGSHALFSDKTYIPTSDEALAAYIHQDVSANNWLTDIGTCFINGILESGICKATQFLSASDRLGEGNALDADKHSVVIYNDEIHGRSYFHVTIDKYLKHLISDFSMSDVGDLVDQEIQSYNYHPPGAEGLDLTISIICMGKVDPLTGTNDKFNRLTDIQSNTKNTVALIESSGIGFLINIFKKSDAYLLKKHITDKLADNELPSIRIDLKEPEQQFSTSFELEDHVVYCVYDCDNKLRYIGEGRPDRPNHVNSGFSHNKKINQHFFLKGPMHIAILAKGLTKSAAKVIEYKLIQELGEDLWNAADNKFITTEHTQKWDAYSKAADTNTILTTRRIIKAIEPQLAT